MLESLLNLTTEQKRQIEKEIGPIRSIAEFCSGLIEGTHELKENLVELLPWATKAGKIVAEVTPLTKMLVKVVDQIANEKDPETLGLLACSQAYQHSAALALAQIGEPRDRVLFERSLDTARQELQKLTFPGDLSGFSLDAPIAHPFMWKCDEALSYVIRSAGYSESEWRQIQLRVHDQFRTDLVEILSHGETAPRFEPFIRRLSLGDNNAAYAAINAHIERQRGLFESRAVLNIEPFTLSEVYVDMDCGKLQWKDFPNSSDSRRDTRPERFDPFSEQFGGRHPLLETVLAYLRDPKFNDALVIQGAPGCGKSSFTLRLANELRRQGLRPLRIRLKFLDMKKNLSEALAQVVLQPEEDEEFFLTGAQPCSDPFLNDLIFQERIKFGTAEICPYVLILDGWDEISVAVNEGFEIEVRRMLDSVRSQFLRPRVPKMRVILTGRPSHAIEQSRFLRDTTPVLTVREYTADQLEEYAGKLKRALSRSTFSTSGKKWPVANWDSLQNIFHSYRTGENKLEILGLPLLAHLSLRLFAQWQGDPERVLSNRTVLYRHLLNVTCLKAGKDWFDTDDLRGQERIRGLELRAMLQQTAAAITAYGNESIPFRELQLRLKKDRKQTMEAAESASKKHPLTSLMISFYFKGGREDLGCEFLHKSFREYLYAEAVVETMKEYGRRQSSTPPKRESYWKDFPDSDPRRFFSRSLSHLLCARPLSPEIQEHLGELIAQEIATSAENRSETQIGEALDPISLTQWKLVRDSLADLWDWWGEGVHLRPQPYRDDSDNLHYRSALINEFLDYSLPRDRSPDAPDWWPGRLVNADANIGDALCQLNAWVHAQILVKDGWQGILVSREGCELQSTENDRSQYQTRYTNYKFVYVLFKPSGSDRTYFRNYCSRINAAGHRPGWPFPSAIFLGYVDLENVDLSGLDLIESDLGGADLRDVGLRESCLEVANLRYANFRDANLFSADLIEADLTGANASDANFCQADLTHSNLYGTRLSGADLTAANLTSANLRGANLTGADLERAILTEADLADAELRDVNFKFAELTDIRGLSEEQLLYIGQMNKAQ